MELPFQLYQNDDGQLSKHKNPIINQIEYLLTIKTKPVFEFNYINIHTSKQFDDHDMVCYFRYYANVDFKSN